MLFKLGLYLDLKFRYVLAHSRDDLFEIILKFGPQTLFEFFAIHLVFPP